MTRTEFNAYLSRFVWRDGDTGFESDLSLIIRMGEARMARDLMVLRRVKMETLTATGTTIDLPDDYYSVRSLKLLTAGGGGSLTYITPYASNGGRSVGYTVRNDSIEVSGLPDDGEFVLEYYTTLPTYDDEETWVQQHYFDLYVYACLLNTAPYLREDARLAEWEASYDKAISGTLQDDARRAFNGSPLQMKLPGIVA